MSQNSVFGLNKFHGKVGRDKAKALGRGPGSGKGKTSGRGGKGQTARSGVSINGFEGGQMPVYRRLPKRGFNNFNRISYQHVSLDSIYDLVNSGKINSSHVISLSVLSSAVFSIGKKIKKGIPIKLLSVKRHSEKSFSIPLSIEVHAASKKAVELVQLNGGKVTILQAAAG